MPSFKERVSTFWKWFRENEKKLVAYFEKPHDTDPTPTREMLGSALNRIIDELPFEFGGNYEICFSANGRSELAFLTHYLANSMPKELKKRWRVMPLKPPADTDCQISMFDRQLGFDDVLVAMEPAGGGRFHIRFYNDTLNRMDENDAYFFFFILMDASLGEGISITHIDMADKLDAPEDGMIPLSGLKDAIAAQLAEEEKKLNDNPCECYIGYSTTPDEDVNPEDLDLRHDIISGFTCQSRMMDDYYNDMADNFTLYANAGAKAAFIWYHHEKEDLRDALEERNEITDRIIDEILGKPDTGKELGISTGQATGIARCYIDLLLYDEKAFLAKIADILKDYDLEFYYSDYHARAESRELPKQLH